MVQLQDSARIIWKYISQPIGAIHYSNYLSCDFILELNGDNYPFIRNSNSNTNKPQNKIVDKSLGLFNYYFENSQNTEISLISNTTKFTDNTYFINIAPHFTSNEYHMGNWNEYPCKKMVLSVLQKFINDKDLVKHNISITAWGDRTDYYGNKQTVKVLECLYSSKTLSKLGNEEINPIYIADYWRYTY